MKILHTADWHLGTFRSPVKDGVNLRTEDTKRCLDELIRVANEEKPDYSLVSGDIFHVGRLWSDRCCEEIITAIHYIRELAAVSKQVVVMRGTPNHDGSGQFNVLSEMFADVPNVHVVITPQVISFDDVDIAVLPGFDRGVFRANHPGLSSDEENVVFTNELSNIVTGLKAQCSPEKKSILMAHYTVPGCNTESGQEKAVAYQKAKTEYSAAVFHESETRSSFDREKQKADEQKQVLEKKVAILNESGCVDIEKAHCKFLQDAIEAKEQLAVHEALYVDIAARRECELEKSRQAIADKQAEMDAIGYDAAALTVLQNEFFLHFR